MVRAELWERPVSYAAVGATKAADLLQYPPSGFRPIERRVRLGYGDERWEYAWTQLFTWGIQRLAGMGVEVSETPGEVTELTYTPVGFDVDGTPVMPATVDSSGDALYALARACRLCHRHSLAQGIRLRHTSRSSGKR
jgi:hypothetical protein